jgi:hypothetical protein
LPSASREWSAARWYVGAERTDYFRLLNARHVVNQSLSSAQQVSFVNDVVPIEDRTRLVTGQHHRHPFGNTGAYEVASRRSPTVVQQATRHASPVAGFLERSAPRAHSHAVAVKDRLTSGDSPPQPSLQDDLQRRRNRQ